MDADFLKELDDKFSNVGREQLWKKKIGKHTIWFSPPSQDDQMKINETMSSDDLGVHLLSEVKKQTLSLAIVGIDDLDLTKTRMIGPIPHPKKKGESVNLPLDKFLLVKIGQWGAQFVDDAFKVFADLMESHEKENLKNITFENLKDPAVELAEAEARVDELRETLGINMPTEAEISKAADEEAKADEEDNLEGFDPFKSPEESGGRIPQDQPPAKPVIPVPDVVPSAPVEESTSRASQVSHVEKAKPEITGDPSKPASLPSSQSDEVVDKVAPKIEKEKIKIDEVKQSRNPRFQPAKKI